MSDSLVNAVVRKLPWPVLPEPGHLWPAFRVAWRRGRTRRRLVELDEHDLKDIGVSRSDAEAEANKPFWAA